MKNLTKIMLTQLNKFIADKENYSKYRSEGYTFNFNLLTSELIVNYCETEYIIKITKNNHELYWTLTPYNNSIFNTKLDTDRCNLDFPLFAIKDNEMFYKKKGDNHVC